MQARGSVVEHAIGANEGLLPSWRADEAGFEKQFRGLDDQLVEVFQRNLALLLPVYQDDIPILGMVSQSGEPVRQAAFGRKDTVLETKALGVVGLSGVA
jgi:hypothetical protein